MSSELEELERHALKSHPYGRLTGASLAVHAIPDAFLVLHTGVGCKYKGAGQYCLHDLGRPSHHREGYTEVTDLALIRGSAQRIGPYLRSWQKKRRPAFMAVAASTFLEMTGEDFRRAVEEAAPTLPCPAAYVRTLGFDGDLYEGYNAVVAEVLRRVPFAQTRPEPGRAALIGYPFDRYEMDHAANLQQLAYLLRCAGLKPGPVLLSGRPYRELLGAAAAQKLVLLPYAAALAPELKAASGRELLLARGLPVGVAGSLRWMRDAALWAGAGRAEIGRLAAEQLAYARPMLDMFRAYASQRAGRGRCAIFADTPLAAGLASLACELGLPPVLVGLRDSSLGGRRAFLEALEWAGAQAPQDLELLEHPSLEAAAASLSRARRKGLALVIGSSSELNVLGAEGRERELPFLELGFPSVTCHALSPSPYYGIAGALALAQRIMNLLR